MTAGNAERRPATHGPATTHWFDDRVQSTTLTPDAQHDRRARCVRCGYTLTDPRSLARGYGRVCWRRALLDALDARRDAVGRRLRALASRVALLDAAGLALVTTALEDAQDALGGAR